MCKILMTNTLSFLLLLLSLYNYAAAQNEAFVQQIGDGASPTAGIGLQINQIGSNNQITGPAIVYVDDGTPMPAAYQNAGDGSGYNDLSILQIDETTHNLIKLSQTAEGDNCAKFEQISGFANLAAVEQYAGTDNYIDISQSNSTDQANNIRAVQLTGDLFNPVETTDGSAVQKSENGSNHLEIVQQGNNNDVGLFQEAALDNAAVIFQFGDDNYVAAYMVNTGGDNSLILTQTGGMTLKLYRIATEGNNSYP